MTGSTLVSLTVYLPKTEYTSLIIKESSGDITLPEGFTFGSINLSLSTGHIDSLASSTGLMHIDTDTGNVTGSLLSSKVFIAHSNAGDIDVPETTSGGKCKITTNIGDIKQW